MKRELKMRLALAGFLKVQPACLAPHIYHQLASWSVLPARSVAEADVGVGLDS